MAGKALQEQFLNRARKEKQALTVFLTNGFQLRGRLVSFDDYSIVLDTDGKQQFIYKHAVSTLVPSRPVELAEETQA